MIDDRDNDDNDGRRKYVNLMWSLDLVKWRKAGEDKRRWRLKRPRPGRECKAKRPRHAPLVFNFFATADRDLIFWMLERVSWDDAEATARVRKMAESLKTEGWEGVAGVLETH